MEQVKLNVDEGKLFTITEKKVGGFGIRVSCKNKSREAGRAYLYILKNDLHEEPFGLIEDVFVNEDFRCQGVGKFLICKALKIAAEHSCYKVIATSREERGEVHKLYERLGFEKYGIEFRMNLE